MAKKKKHPRWTWNTEELLDAPIIRKYMPFEWLSKLSTRDFKAWENHTRAVLNHDKNLGVADLDAKIWERVEERERHYQLAKDRRALEAEKLRLEKKLKTEKISLARFERSYKNKTLYNLNTFDIVPHPGSRKAYGEGVHKYDSKGEIKLGGELVEYNKVNKNGRIYPPPTATTEQHYFEDPYGNHGYR